MRGHDLLPCLRARRLSLRCADCGWESDGWVIDPPKFARVWSERGVPTVDITSHRRKKLDRAERTSSCPEAAANNVSRGATA